MIQGPSFNQNVIQTRLKSALDVSVSPDDAMESLKDGDTQVLPASVEGNTDVLMQMVTILAYMLTIFAGLSGKQAVPPPVEAVAQPSESVTASAVSNNESPGSAVTETPSLSAPVVSLAATESQPPNSVNVKDFGAVGDGVADDQAALQKAIDQAKASGQSVWLPPGTYNHSGVLTLDGAKMSGAGHNTILHATNPDQSAIRLTGEGSSISNLQTTVVAPSRSSMPDPAAVLVQNATNATVNNVRVQGASSNGIRLDNATGSKIFNNLVLGTNADGIALMNGSSGNLVRKNVVYQAGDDSYSDDSYNGDAKQDDGNVFDGNLSLDNAYGRGITLAGSSNATVKNNIVSGSRWIGIWGDSDPNSGTMESRGHTIQDNIVINNPNGAPVQANGPGTTITGTITTGSVPSLASILGWDPGVLPDRYSFNSIYQPGTGSGANNTAGNRT